MKHTKRVLVHRPGYKPFYREQEIGSDKVEKYLKKFKSKKQEESKAKAKKYLENKIYDESNKQNVSYNNTNNKINNIKRFSNKYDNEIKTREDAIKKLNDIGIKYEENGKITDELLVDNVKALAELNDEYGIDNNILNKLIIKDTGKSYAEFDSSNSSITLNSKYFSNNEYLTSEMLKNKGKWFCDFEDKFANVYSIHHEFSHYLERLTYTEEKIKQIINGNNVFNNFIEYDEMLWKNIHAGRYKIKDISQYGFNFYRETVINKIQRGKYQEAIAESYASYKCGGNNDIGKAIDEFYKRRLI